MCICIGVYVACTMGACSVCLWLWGPGMGLNKGRGVWLSSDRGVCWWGELIAAMPSSAHGGCPSKACLTCVSSVAVLGSSLLP